MALLDYLETYVKTGTAEGDRRFLSHIFCPPEQFSQLCAIEAGGMRLLVGDKGIGKSAIVEHILESATAKKLPALILRPDDIALGNSPGYSDLASLKNYYYENLVKSISANVGKKLKGFLLGDKKVLYDEARRQGIAPEDMITYSLELFSAISAAAGKVNGVELAKKLSGPTVIANLVPAIQNVLLGDRHVFYLLIDDTDQIAAPDKPEHLNRIWALILAVRKLVGECPAIRPIITLRTGVWTRMSTESRGQRDQTDHLRGYVVHLKINESNIKDILRKRLLRAASDMSVKGLDPYNVFFEGEDVFIPTSDQKRIWSDFIFKSSRDRPRDAIQLIKNMIDVAENRAKKISSKNAEAAIKIYSTERIDDVVNEFSLDCNNVKEVMDSFSEIEFEMDFETLRNHLHNVPGIGSTIVRSRTIQQGNDEDSISLLSLLHEIGFINPRIKSDSLDKKKGFDHLLFRDNPSFTRVENWNEMQAVRWEVHPAFRSYLLGKKEARRKKFGVG